MLKFGDKIRFKNQKAVHKELRGEFCLLGIDKSAVAIIEWEKRGDYNMHFISCDPKIDLEKIEII